MVHDVMIDVENKNTFDQIDRMGGEQRTDVDVLSVDK